MIAGEINDTIFAVSSGKGRAGVSVIRISGKNTLDFLKKTGINTPAPREAKLVNLKDFDGELIDKCLLIYFNAPHSFTGEDVVELHVHGSIAVVSEVLKVCGQIENFRSANAGEFSQRAFYNGKMDLLQAEGLADLIDAETKAQAKQALRQMSGNASKFYDEIREKIIEIMAFCEAFVDFPDEEIPQDLDIQAQNKVLEMVKVIDEKLANNSGEILRGSVVVAITGKPNVGKSSIINNLAGRDIAIVSSIAGTTRDSIECHLDISGIPITLIDTAGIRETEDEIEKEGVRRALEKAENADINIFVSDNFEDLGTENSKQKNAIFVLNKCDLIADGESGIKPKKSNIKEDINAIFVSAKLGTGIENLIAEIKNNAEKILEKSESAVVTRERHRKNLEECARNLIAFVDSRKQNAPIEICAENLRSAAYHAGKIIGKIGVEDVLDKIFSSFCIGK